MTYDTKNILNLTITAALAVTIALVCLWKISTPVDDPDLWWHLKTGQQLVTTGTLPLRDDFAYTSEGFDTPRERSILRGYPLTQAALFLLYNSMGNTGIMVWRLILCAALIAVILFRCRQSGVSLPLSLAVLCAGLAAFLSSYSLERPQNLSFLFFAILLGLLERLEREQRPSWWLFPLMLLWANCHGGFIVGDVCLALFAIGYLIRTGLKRAGWNVCAWCAGGILASLINPNGYAFFLEMLSITEKRSFGFIQEYQSIWVGIASGDRSDITMTIMVLIWAFGIIINAKVHRSLPLPMLLANAFVIAISFKYTRNAPFILLAMVPVVAAAINSLTTPREGGQVTAKRLAAIVCGVIVLAVIWSHPAGITRPAFTTPQNVSTYPDKAVQFITGKRLQGRIFNEYNWGGYLIWKLYPQQRVFIDGRVLNEALLDDYIRIAKGSLSKTAGGKYQLVYAQLLNNYHVDVIIQSNVQMQYGDMQPLTGRLLDDPTWIPVYLDEHAYIFVRNGTNEPVVAAYRIDKKDFLRRMEAMMRTSGNTLAMADLLIYQNRLAEAAVLLQQRQPGNHLISRRLAFITQQQRGHQ